jgi:periplasmic protein TonB
MGADTSAQPAGRSNAQRTPMVAAIAVRERGFWTGLAFAAVVHAALLVGFLRAPPRMMGEASGLADGISVELVEAPDLKSKNTFAEDGGQPGTAAKPVPKPPQKQAAAEPQPATPQKSSPEPAEQAPPAQPQTVPQQPEKQKANPWVPDIAAIDLAQPPPTADPARSAEEAPKAPPAKKQQQVELPKQLPQPEPKQQQKLSLQFDMPPMAFTPGTRGAAVTRPAGITRSGENDEFGRGVIRALRKTMPASSVLGRVTVRFLVSQTGNLAEVRLISGGGDPILSQNVVFAVKQSSFPFPPAGATEVDRTFQVTYVYH